jgi:hypothetical protein
MEPTRTFDHIWYRSKPVTESSRADPFTRERGRLIAEGDTIRFEGKTTRLVMRNVEAVEYGVYGTMANPSVLVRYREDGEPRSAWLTDGGLGGYAGMFGGTRRLAQALGVVAPASFDDAGAGVMQKRMLYLLLAIILAGIVRALRAG